MHGHGTAAVGPEWLCPSTRLAKSFSLEFQRGVAAMLLDILRLALAFGVVVLVIGFWYWVMDTLGTF
jgi:hypothetical protein